MKAETNFENGLHYTAETKLATMTINAVITACFKSDELNNLILEHGGPSMRIFNGNDERIILSRRIKQMDYKEARQLAKAMRRIADSLDGGEG